MNEISDRKKGIAFALIAAIFYAFNAPFSKILLKNIPSTLLAGFLYLGAAFSMILVFSLRKINKNIKSEKKLEKEELPYTIMMIILDILAPISLLIGLKSVSASSAALLNNFEIIATTLIAFFFFKEKIGKRLFLGILFVFISCIFLTVDDFSDISLNKGALFILLAGTFWGLENNCTRKLSEKDPLQIVFLKGFFSGLGSLIIGLFVGEKIENYEYILFALILGMFSYGLSIFFYVYAQRFIGASRTSAYYSVAPFVASFLSFIILNEKLSSSYFIALIFMLFGAFLCEDDTYLLKRKVE